MKFNGAMVKIKDQVIGVAVVEEDFLELDAKTQSERMIQYRKGFAQKIPVIALISSIANKEKYFGRPDLIAQVKDVPLNMMTFKTWTVKDN